MSPALLPIWNNDPVNVERQPDGPGALGPLFGWTGNGLYGGEYWIRLNGCNPSVASGPQAGMWAEAADAPSSATGQATSGAGSLSWIEGTLSDGADVDVFTIFVTDVSTFSARASGYPDADTQLFLFDPGGTGIVFNDDSPEGGTTFARITGARLPAPGEYELAVSAFNRDPIDSGALPIWLDEPFSQERAPDGPGSPGPLATWAQVPDSGGVYEIALTGARFDASTIAVPGRRSSIKAIAMRAFPSPSGALVRIRLSLPRPVSARLTIFDAKGRRMRSLLGGERIAEDCTVEWDGRDDRGLRAPAGVYFAKLDAADDVVIGRIVLLR